MAQDEGPDAQGLGLGLELGGVSTATAADTSSTTAPAAAAATTAATTSPPAGAESALSKKGTQAVTATASISDTTSGAATEAISELDGSGQRNGQGGQSAMDADMSGRHPSDTPHHATYSVDSTSTPAASYPPITATYHQTSHAPQTQYASYGSPTPQHDLYRSSGSPMSLEAAPHQNQHPLPHGAASAMNYYAPQPLTHLPSNYALPSDRFGMHHDPRLRQPKKEIKRRTKTGCLTCRKRRIKCDEGHPTCNNCRKSKRECLGYDPIFRQQTLHLVNTYNQSLPDHEQATSPSEEHQALPSDTQTRPVAAQNPASAYSTQPDQPFHRRHPSNGHSSAHTPDTAGAVKTEHGPNPPANTSFPQSSVKSETASPATVAANIQRAEPARLAGPDPQALSQPRTNTTASTQQQYHHRPPPGPTKMKIDQIIDLLGPPPPAQHINHDDETISEVTKVYHEMYAAALSAFFETSWYYFMDNGKISFPKDHNLVESMATFLKILEAVKANDQAQMAYSGILETRIVWQLAKTAASVEGSGSAMRISLPADGDAWEARCRLVVVEALLCGECLPSNPLTAPMQEANSTRGRQFDFWYQLGEFVRVSDPTSTTAAAVKAREESLSRMRHLLDGRENRDVLYSIAVVRELSPYFPADYANTVPQHLDEADPKNRLAVASKFILDESQVTGGTTNVVRRFSDIAARAFIVPGVNIARPGQG